MGRIEVLIVAKCNVNKVASVASVLANYSINSSKV